MQNKDEETKLAVVTGGSRGIGASTVTMLAKSGYRVVFFYMSRTDVADALVEQLTQSGYYCSAMQVDVSDRNSVAEARAKIFQDYGAPNVLVSNAGRTDDSLVIRMRQDQWDSVIATNLHGAFHVIREFSEIMLKDGGSIILISSVAGLMGVEGQVNYCASKFGIIGLTKSIARELGRFDIRVNAVAPGYIDTEMTKLVQRDKRKSIIKTIPLKRLGDADDVANVVEYLASDNSRYITGTVLTVDGGLSA